MQLFSYDFLLALHLLYKKYRFCLNIYRKGTIIVTTSLGFDPVLSHIYLIFAIVKGNFVIYNSLIKTEHKYNDVLRLMFQPYQMLNPLMARVHAHTRVRHVVLAYTVT